MSAQARFVSLAVLRRRGVVLLFAAAAAFGTLGLRTASASSFDVPLPIPSELKDPNIAIDIRQAPIQILPGAATNMWTFNGTFPGPTIRRHAGETTTITFTNGLPPSVFPPSEPSPKGALTIHVHGEHSTSANDGQPDEMPASSGPCGSDVPGLFYKLLITPGCQHTYTYDLKEDGAPERPAFQWYHDHRMGETARNVWMGLAGMFIIDPPAGDHTEDTLPAGKYDVPMMLTDRSFDANNQLDYHFNNSGVIGDHVLVNGADHPYFDVDDVKYRVRILNASNARPYDVELSNGQPMTQIATESGLLPAPIQVTHIRLGPAERAEVVIDFKDLLNSSVVLRDRLGFGPSTELMQFNVTQHAMDFSSIPGALRELPKTVAGLKACASLAIENCPLVTRTWVLGQSVVPNNPEWTINGRAFDHMRDDAEPKLGSAERWIFINATGVDHLVHIHDVDWRLVWRSGGLPPSTAPGVDVDQLKETFLVQPYEAIVLISTFTDHLGRFVFHCHILEHEDHSMMAQFNVVP